MGRNVPNCGRSSLLVAGAVTWVRIFPLWRKGRLPASPSGICRTRLLLRWIAKTLGSVTMDSVRVIGCTRPQWQRVVSSLVLICRRSRLSSVTVCESSSAISIRWSNSTRVHTSIFAEFWQSSSEDLVIFLKLINSITIDEFVFSQSVWHCASSCFSVSPSHGPSDS